MAYEPISKIKSTVVPLTVDNVDTDQIIPARFLKATSRDADFGSKLFSDWRYEKDGSPKTDFALNRYSSGSKVLLTGENFGCGSSREHAAWALYDYGFRVVIGSSFADIFRNNSLNNGLLVIPLEERFYQNLLKAVLSDSLVEVEVDLDKQTVSYLEGKEVFNFDINPFRKQCLKEGADLLDFLVARKDKIAEFEQNLI